VSEGGQKDTRTHPPWPSPPSLSQDEAPDAHTAPDSRWPSPPSPAQEANPRPAPPIGMANSRPAKCAPSPLSAHNASPPGSPLGQSASAQPCGIPSHRTQKPPDSRAKANQAHSASLPAGHLPHTLSPRCHGCTRGHTAITPTTQSEATSEGPEHHNERPTRDTSYADPGHEGPRAAPPEALAHTTRPPKQRVPTMPFAPN